MTTATADSSLIELVRTALAKSELPLKATDLKKNIPNPQKKQITPELLDEIAASGRIVAYPPLKGKTVSFGLKDLATLSREAILRDVSAEPRTWAELKKRPSIKAVASLQSAKDLDASREWLIGRGELYEWPKTGAKGSSVRYATRPADADEFLSASAAFQKARTKFLEELAKIAKGLARAGVSTADVERSAFTILSGRSAEAKESQPSNVPTDDRPSYPPELSTIILTGMVEEEPAAAGGAPVSIRNLRRALAFQIPGKQVFDDALRGMADEGVLALHRHDFPGGLTDFEREELVSDGRGGFYVAVSRRS
ncbi:MAG: hypothetical protein AB7I30_11310 [Isosphaeraceae bacterium]